MAAQVRGMRSIGPRKQDTRGRQHKPPFPGTGQGRT